MLYMRQVGKGQPPPEGEGTASRTDCQRSLLGSQSRQTGTNDHIKRDERSTQYSVDTLVPLFEESIGLEGVLGRRRYLLLPGTCS